MISHSWHTAARTQSGSSTLPEQASDRGLSWPFECSEQLCIARCSASNVRSLLHTLTLVSGACRMEDAPLCHLCCNELDATDLASKLCACDFAICLWCWTKLCEETGRCPNCRALYDVERTRRQALDTKQCA